MIYDLGAVKMQPCFPGGMFCLGASLWDKGGCKGNPAQCNPSREPGMAHMGNRLPCGGLLGFFLRNSLWVWFYFYHKQCFLWISSFLFIISRAESFGTTVV